MIHTKYLIIGNGIAGLSAAKEIRNNDKEGSITIISSESDLTYYRTKLTHGIANNLTESDLLIHDEQWYKEKKMDVLLKRIVVKLDLDNNLISLDDGQTIVFERLLIATGSRPFIPPIAGKYKDGIFALRTIRDLKFFKDYIKSSKTVTVIGGGLLGLEAAWSLKLLGKDVNVIEFAPYLMPRQLDKELGEKLATRLTEKGINIYLPKLAEEILGDEKANGIIVSGGEVISTDAILISSGIRPNLDLVRESGIVYDKGIKVNERLETNVANVYAAGDVAEVNNSVIGLWTASHEQGRVAGSNMSGVEKTYEVPKLFSTLKIGDINVFSAGDIVNYDRILEYRDDLKDIHHKLFTKDGKIIGAILFGDLQGLNTIRNGVFNQIRVESYLKNGIKFK